MKRQWVIGLLIGLIIMALLSIMPRGNPMSTQAIFGGLAATFFAWRLYYGIKNNGAAFSRENLSKSFGTIGLLCLLLIGVVSVAVMILR